jgi:hypothetical protein
MTVAKEDNILEFKRLSTDNSGSDGDADWLRTLPFETRFLCQKKASQSYAYDAYGIAMVLPESILLAGLANDSPLTKFEWVDSKKFSKQHILIGMLPTTEQGVTLHDDDLLPGPADSDHDE